MHSQDESFISSTAYRERYSWARIFVTVVVICGFGAGAWWLYDVVR